MDSCYSDYSLSELIEEISYSLYSICPPNNNIEDKHIYSIFIDGQKYLLNIKYHRKRGITLTVTDEESECCIEFKRDEYSSSFDEETGAEICAEILSNWDEIEMTISNFFENSDFINSDDDE